MNRTARWTTLLATAAIVALPASGFAQDPPVQSQQAATPQSPAAAAMQTASADAAKAHLTAARNTLSQITQLPAAAQLQGESRSQVAQLINNFNELITTQADWKAAYAKVEANLTALLAQPEEAARPSGTAGAVGTSGSTKTGIDATIRAKLVELRSQLDQFEKAAGAPAADAAATAATATPPAATSTTSTTTTTSTTATEPPVAAAAPPATPAPTTADAPPSVPPSNESVTVNPQDLIRHIEAIEVILSAHAAAQNRAQTAAGGAMTSQSTPSGSTKTTITSSDIMLNQTQVNELRQHLSDLRKLLDKK
jgi:hypothetical protein